MNDTNDQGMRPKPPTRPKRPLEEATPDGPATGMNAPISGAGNDPLLDQAREIVYQTPEIRAEQVARIKEAIEQGNYEIEARHLANTLIVKILLGE